MTHLGIECTWKKNASAFVSFFLRLYSLTRLTTVPFPIDFTAGWRTAMIIACAVKLLVEGFNLWCMIPATTLALKLICRLRVRASFTLSSLFC
ncbi:hypothetical protein EUGRSUZ_E03032 [Eucalyptus grandis]|uniref:Uncharacterized protein n=2 Tax=Eucalyptus grandis TaxID=71139 RepID=A0ACC3L226_EUCGR|nr:hypothetical protein EUGRSUZ_E03032 [Eucalyptus grandis]